MNQEDFVKRAKVDVLKADAIEQAGERFAFDFASMKTIKERVPLDYGHDDEQIIGYCEGFSFTPEGVSCEAVFFAREDDPQNIANDVCFNVDAGVPYEASALIDLTGAEAEDVAEGETAEINGREVVGPMIVYYGATIRGVAVCPHGADPQTAFIALSGTPTKREVNTIGAESVVRKELKMEQENTTPTLPDSEGLKAYCEEFGKELGVEYYLAGMTLADARQADYAKLKANRDAAPEPKPEPVEENKKCEELSIGLSARLDEFEKRLNVLALSLKRGESEGVSASVPARERPTSALERVAKAYSERGSVRN